MLERFDERRLRIEDQRRQRVMQIADCRTLLEFIQHAGAADEHIRLECLLIVAGSSRGARVPYGAGVD